jgi:general L-amino acid transport system substrate-binding protein
MNPISKRSGRFKKVLATTIILATGLVASSASAGETLDKIKQRGLIKIGVGTTPGFFTPDSNGRGRASSLISAAPWR